MESLNIVFTGKDEVATRTEPVPELGAGQILVQTHKTLISTGTEGIVLRRKFEAGTHWDNWVKYPFHPGYSNAGRVLQVGAGVQNFQPGDRVATRSSHGQYCLADASRAVKIPETIADEDATWFGLAGIVQNGVRAAEHALGDVVVVVGLGLLGQLVVQYVRLMGAREIIAVDTARPRLEMARTHGATQTLAMGVAEAHDAIQELTGGRLADVVYDVTGHPAVFAPALKLVRKFGKLLLLGDSGNPSEQHLTADVVSRGLRIIGAHDTNPPATATDRDYWTNIHMQQLFFSYLERGQMRVNDLVTHRYLPQQAREAYAMLETDRASAMGVLFDWTQVAAA
ncbi:MAG TPA: zinc-binding alcohol dehydrogenase [Abditibacteriaceae bacterium]|nr:zinc-binding alcohol dehydrogenase [Abditibacteriaceae bacterium]